MSEQFINRFINYRKLISVWSTQVDKTTFSWIEKNVVFTISYCDDMVIMSSSDSDGKFISSIDFSNGEFENSILYNIRKEMLICSFSDQITASQNFNISSFIDAIRHDLNIPKKAIPDVIFKDILQDANFIKNCKIGKVPIVTFNQDNGV